MKYIIMHGILCFILVTRLLYCSIFNVGTMFCMCSGNVNYKCTCFFDSEMLCKLKWILKLLFS